MSRVFLLGIVVMVACPILVGCAAPSAAPPYESDHAGKLAPGDLLSVVVYGMEEPGLVTAKPVHIDPAGAVSLYWLGRVKIAGLTPSGAERVIHDAYNAQGPISDTGPIYVRRLQCGDAHRLPATVGNFALVRFEIYDLMAPGESIVQIRRVEGDGTIQVPYLGSVKVVGLTEGEVEQGLIQAYRDANLMHNVALSFLVLEAAPPGAAKMDLPDEPLNAVPPGLEWLYEDRITEPAATRSATTQPTTRP